MQTQNKQRQQQQQQRQKLSLNIIYSQSPGVRPGAKLKTSSFCRMEVKLKSAHDLKTVTTLR